MPSAMPIITLRLQGWRRSVGGHAPAGANDRGAAGSEAGGIRGRETVTAAGEGDTESVDHNR